jgi:hypothetical protein
MPYIAAKPGTAFRTFTDRDNFTGDGSTTAFDMQFAIDEAGLNDLKIYVNDVLQVPTDDYTLGVDSAGDYKRITFTSAPTNGHAIVILNPGTVRGGFATVADNAITSSKLNTEAITGQTELAERAATDDEFLVYDTSTSAIKKIQTSNIVKATVQRTYTGDGSTAAFTVTSGVAQVNTLVFVNGISMMAGTDYTISGTTLTFSTTPSVGDNIDIRELPA